MTKLAFGSISAPRGLRALLQVRFISRNGTTSSRNESNQHGRLGMPTGGNAVGGPLQRAAARLADLCDWVDRIAMGVAAAGLVVMVSAVVLEVVIRLTFARSMLFADEIASYMLAVMSFLALGNTLRGGGHLTVGLLTERLGPKTRKWLNVAIVLLALVCMYYFTSWLLRLFIESYTSGERSQSEIQAPLWIPQSALVMGTGVLVLSLISRLIRLLSNEDKA
jgi:TRAP-type C4-dicarboxylate transport system permease small subunit